MKPLLIVGVVLGVLVYLAIGLVIAQGPQPEIIVPAEVLFKLGPLNVTNTLLTSWCVMIFIILFFVMATRSMKLMPSGLQNFAEAVIGFLVGQVEDIAGEKNGRRFFIVVATIFIYLIVNNWFGLLPFFNAVGNLEDVNHHVVHELTSEEPEDLELGPDGHYIAAHKFAGWKMDGDSGIVIAKPRTKAVDFEVHQGETPAEALDRYIVFVAKNFTDDFEADEEALAHPSAELVTAAAAALSGADGAPKLLVGEAGHGEGAAGAHGLDSPVLHQHITGIDFEGAQKFALVIPWFRGTFSDVNNTLAMGIIAFLCIEFWGFQALGIGYLGKFFNFKSPIGAFVGFLEFLSELIRVVSFTFRLFGNIFAGEVLVLMLTFLMPFLFVDIIYGLELFVGFIQAAVFSLLTLVFAVGAVEHHGEDEHHEGHHDEGATGDAHNLPAGASPAH